MSKFDWVKCDFQTNALDNTQVFQTKDLSCDLALYVIQECGHIVKVPSSGFRVHATESDAKLVEVDLTQAVTFDDYLGDLALFTDTFEFYTPHELFAVEFVQGLATQITATRKADK